MIPGRLRPLLVLAVMVVLHVGVLADLHVRHVRGDGMLLLVILVGLNGGPQWGTVTGFVAGVVADLTLQTPFGLSALVLTLVGFTVGTVQTAILRAAWWIAPLTVLVASAVGVVLFALLGGLVGQSQMLRPGPAHLAGVAGLVALTNAVLAVPAAALVRWGLAGRDELGYSV
jgi:rod shape-determining protein MreD